MSCYHATLTGNSWTGNRKSRSVKRVKKETDALKLFRRTNHTYLNLALNYSFI